MLTPLTFELERLRLHFYAVEDIHFAPYMSGNVLRGAFGFLLRDVTTSGYVRIFRPASESGPSGLRDSPRPFVLRAAYLDGCTVKAGEAFHFDVHLFDASMRDHFTEAFAQFERAKLEHCEVERISIDLLAAEPASRVGVEFLTPTELKSGGDVTDRLDFGVLFARLRDRIATLRTLYGGGPLDIDFRALGERASAIELIDQRIERIDVERRSSHTGWESSTNRRKR